MSHFKKAIALCAVTFLVYGTSVYAAPKEAAQAAAGQQNDGMLHNLDAIHAQLKLSADQELQWQATQTASSAAQQQEHSIFAQYQQQFQTLMQAPVLDFQALDAMREHVGEQLRQMHQQTQASWLKWYGSLNLTQKTLVSSTLKAQWQKMKAHALQ